MAPRGKALTSLDIEFLYRDLIKKAKIAIRRTGITHLDPFDLANDIYVQFKEKDKMKYYDPKRGASKRTFACFVCNNMLKNHLRRGDPLKDDCKRLVSDTMTQKTNPYFYNMAKENAIDEEPEGKE